MLGGAEGRLPLTFGQERLWFHAALEPEAVRPLTSTARIRGALDFASFRSSLEALVLRRDPLRTTFEATDEGPRRFVAASTAPPVIESVEIHGIPERAFRRWLEAEKGRSFDVARGPLFRTALVRLGPLEHVAVLASHPLLMSAESHRAFWEDLARGYRGEPAAAPAQLATRPSDAGEHERVAFWADVLSRIAPRMELPGLHRDETPKAGIRTHAKRLTPQIALFAEGSKIVLAAAVLSWLHRVTGNREVALGIESDAGQGAMDPVDLVPLVVDFDGNPTFLDGIRRTEAAMELALERRPVPFAEIARELRRRGRDVPRFFQLALRSETADSRSVDVPGATWEIDVEPVLDPDTEAGLVVRPNVEIACHTAGARPEAGARLLGSISALVEAAVSDPSRLVSALPLVSRAERHRLLVELNDTAVEGNASVPVHVLIEEAARRFPEAVAVEEDDATLSYRELLRRTRLLAGALRRRGLGAECIVGLALERSVDLIIALLAVLEAGAAYLPLDPDYPDERLRFMIRDSGVSLVLTQSKLRPRVEELVGRERPVSLLCTEDIEGERDVGPPPDSGNVEPHHTAYVIYTSGSTGTPKGVAIEHGTLANHTRSAVRGFALGPHDRVLQFTPTSFDTAGEEIYPALASGATLVLRTGSLVTSPAGFWAEVRRRKLTVLNLPTAFWHELVADATSIPDSLRVLIIGGEAAAADRILEWSRLPRARSDSPRLFNTYGATEAGMVSLRSELDSWRSTSEGPPLGRPIDNVRVHVLDERLEPVPVGCLGELYIGGAGVARGYVGRPELTAERFVPDPFGRKPGARLFRTGDLARYLPDGSVAYVGRIDHQVKIRGYRIEPAEVEAALLAHPAVAAAAVVPRDIRGAKRLVAYFVSADSERPRSGGLRAFLAKHLPEFMLPSMYVALDDLPKTPSGKVDRLALPEPDTSRPDVGAPAIPPRTTTERILSSIWKEVLSLEDVGVRDHFFDLGGHSLLATQLLSRIARTFEVELSLKQVFDAPTIEELAACIESASRRAAPPIALRPGEPAVPLSFSQQRLWFLERLAPGTSAYHMGFAHRLEGPLDVGALARSLRTIVHRHEALRTTFPSASGSAVQRVGPAAFELPVVPASEESQGARILEEADTPFDLENGPLFRARLLRLGDERHVLLLSFHHIVSDGWSMGVFYRELAHLYAAYRDGRPSTLPGLPVQYADFTLWQRERLRGPVLEELLSYWRAKLHNLPTLRLPTDRERRRDVFRRGAVHRFTLDSETARGLRALGHDEGASLFQCLMAVFVALLQRYTGQEDIVVGTPIANRNRPEIEGLIGFFVNSLALRVPCRGDAPFLDVLARVRDAMLDADAHQDLPFEKLVEELRPEREGSRHPLFQVTLALHDAEAARLRLDGVDVAELDGAPRHVRCDLELHLWASGDGLAGEVLYDRELFDRPTIARMSSHYRALSRAFVRDRRQRVRAPDLASRVENHQLLVEWNDRARDYGEERLLHELFEARADERPAATAVAFVEEELSYLDLDRRANAVARKLRRVGVGPETLVGLCMERSIDLVVALIGILKAGGAYVPLDPEQPPLRLAAICEDAGIDVAIADSKHSGRLTGIRHVLCPPFGGGTAHRLAAPVKASHASYLLYTSGSTGAPKGVVVSHGAIRHHMLWMQEDLPLRISDRVLQRTHYGFDASVWEFWAPLLEGATLVVAPPAIHRDPRALVELCRSERITILQVVPSLLRVLVRVDAFGKCSDLRRVLCGGEPLPTDLVDRFFASGVRAELYNVYGPTEATIHASFDRCEAGRGAPTASIGRPIANAACYVLDEELRPLPVGLAGELYVGGCGLARGYHRRPELTAERFVADPFRGRHGARLYRTGDRARFLPDGRLEMLGRLDDQVKLRGHRIELGEVESVLRTQPGVADAAVRLDAPSQETARLVAYLVRERRVSVGEEAENRRISQWQDVYRDLYRGSATPTEPGLDTVGWNSSYTGEPLPEEHMREWVEEAVARTRALGAKRILEIGCGTGLLLSRLAPACTRYVATDFSEPVLDALSRYAEGAGLSHVELRHGAAHELDALEDESFDAVILSSVVQYFPSADYLLRVLLRCVSLLSPGGSLFVGDVRSLPLLRHFAASIESHAADDGLGLRELSERVEERLRDEEELVLDPAFFVALLQHVPRLAHVRVQPRMGRLDNELNRFRYDVTLRADVEPARVEALRLGWDRDVRSLHGLRARLLEGPDALLVTAVPNARLFESNRLLGALERPDAHRDVGELRRILSRGAGGVDPSAVSAVARELGYEAELSWASGDPFGAFDVLLLGGTGRIPVRAFDVPPRPPSWRAYANDPIARDERAALLRESRVFASERLPDYMRPSSYVLVDELPKTSSGKVNRSALPAMEQRLERASNVAPPRTPTEETLAGIWCEVLSLPRVCVRDDFFELGGHSLLAVQVASRIREALHVELALKTLFDEPTLEKLARVVDEERGVPGGPGDAPRARASRGSTAPSSFAQQRLWFLWKLSPESARYTMAFAHEIEGPLDVRALEGALGRILRRHEALRTSFVQEGVVVVQRIAPFEGFQLPRLDTTGEALRETLSEEWRRPFDLENGPLFRALLLGLGPGRHVLLTSFHHIASDGWSTEVFYRELEALYVSPALPELPLQYADFAVWQRERARGRRFDEELRYWRWKLRDVPPLRLPYDGGSRPSSASSALVHRRRLSPGLTRSLRKLARRAEASTSAVILAGLGVFLSRGSGQRDLAVGMPVAHRNFTELESLIGLFVNTLVLRLELHGAPSFEALVVRARRTMLEALEHQDLPFERLVQELAPRREAGRNPLFQAMFAHETRGEPALRLGAANVRALELEPGPPLFDLSLTVREEGDALELELALDPSRVETSRGERWLREVVEILEQCAARPHRPVELPPARKVERMRSAAAGSSPGVAPRTPLEIGLARIWSELLGVDGIGLHDDFFSLGGHSLLVLQMATVIEERLGRRMPVGALFEAPTLGELAGLLEKKDPPRSSRLVPIRRGPSLDPLFLAHPLGGGVLVYEALAKHLARKTVFGLLAPALEDDDPGVATVESMASLYLDEIVRVRPRGPYQVAGWSMGGWIAFEMARQLEARGERAVFVGLLDSGLPGNGDNAGFEEDCLHRLRANGFAPGVSEKRLRRTLESNRRAIERYVPARYSGRITIFVPESERVEDVEGWNAVAGSVRIREVKGDHYTMMEEPLVRFLARSITACLEEQDDAS